MNFKEEKIMKYLFYTWKLGCLLLLVFAGCSSKKSVSSYHSFESECLGVELECSVRPLVTEVNAQERYAYYFNDFFRDGGEYLKYVSMEDKKTNSNMKTSNKTQISYSTTVRVLRSQLQQKLIEDKILKP